MNVYCFGYLNNRMFHLNVIDKFSTIQKFSFVLSSSSKHDDSILWCVILGHVNFRRMCEISNDGQIPPFNINLEKYKTYMLTKVTKQPFPNVTRKSTILEIINNDLCDFHYTRSLGNKNYTVTLIDECTQFYYVYLPNAKNEELEKFKNIQKRVGIAIEQFNNIS